MVTRGHEATELLDSRRNICERLQLELASTRNARKFPKDRDVKTEEPCLYVSVYICGCICKHDIYIYIYILYTMCLYIYIYIYGHIHMYREVYVSAYMQYIYVYMYEM